MRQNPLCPVYNLYSVALQVVDEIKYLGIIDNRLNCDSNVRYTTSRANRMLGLIYSMAIGLSTDALFVSSYKSVVLPILEYGLPVWNLHTQKLADDLERIQRRASHIVLKQRRIWKCLNQKDCNFLTGSTYYFLFFTKSLRTSPVILLAILFIWTFVMSMIFTYVHSPQGSDSASPSHSYTYISENVGWAFKTTSNRSI